MSETTSIDRVRAGFETWVTDSQTGSLVERDGIYRDPAVEGWWQAWQARGNAEYLAGMERAREICHAESKSEQSEMYGYAEARRDMDAAIRTEIERVKI
jgi:hypothetical protein